MADRFDLINFGKSVVTTLGGTTANVNIDANTLFIDGTNNRVGVGTAAPSALLHARTGASDGTNGLLLEGGVTNKTVMIRPSMGAGNNNNLVQAGDGGIIFDGGSINTGAFVIAPWASTTSGMRIDASGRMFTPSQPMFHAFSSSMANIGISGTNNVVVIPNTATLNVGAHYSTSTGRFTAPVAGTYMFYAQVPYTGISGATYTGISIRRNSGGLVDGYTSGSYNYSQAVASIIVTLAANDFVDVSANYSLTSGNIESGATGRMYFGGYLLG